ncbi:uncharacterized protein H6S33_010398 [Morchella sextelata]|uniref:uncharacterized protein n=1 Tax=Morchella sextelata TaxID=1174677 RepID=UPI001D056E5A|nr:uncharacterized protein H6S33_010398 [Morchella sextelata]KAH0612346.1 hypothetical protein H6S33_010398 [Morchella sextelata]
MTTNREEAEGEEAPFYPRRLFDYSPTFTAPLPLTAHDIHTTLTAHPLFAGQNILHHNNHPVHVVRIVGLLVALDTYDIRHALVLDDGSGATIDAMIWRQRREGAGGVPGMAVELPEEAVVGCVLGVEGVVGVFRGVRQVEVQRLWVLRDTAEEVAAWAEVLEMRRGVLSRPWVLEERVLERERRKVEREARAVERAVAAAAVAAERTFVGRRRAPGQTFEVVVPPVERTSSVADGQEETERGQAPKVIKYIGHRRTSKPPEAPVEPLSSPVEPALEASSKFIGRRRPSRPPEVPTEPTPDPEPAQPALRYIGHKRTSRPPEVPPIFESPVPPPAEVVLVQAAPPGFVGRRRTSRPPELPVEPVPEPAVKFIGRRRPSKPPEEPQVKEEPAPDAAVKFVGRRRASKPPEEPAVEEEPVVVAAASKYIGHRRASKPPEEPPQEPPQPPIKKEPFAVVVPKYIGHRRTGSKPPEPPAAAAAVVQEPTTVVVASAYIGHKHPKPLEPAPAETKTKYVGHKRSTTVVVPEPAYRALKRIRPLPEDDEEPAAGSGSRGQKRQKLPMQPFSSSSEYCSGGSGSHRRPSTKAAPPPPEVSSSVFRGKCRTEPQPPILSASQVPQELLDSICLSSPASTPASKASPPPPLRRGRSSGMHEAAPPSAQPQPQVTPQPQTQYRGRRRHPSARISEQSTSLTPVGAAKSTSVREPARRVRREKEKGNDMMTSSMESMTSTSTYRGSRRYGTRAMTSSQETEQRRSRKRSSRAARSSQEEAAYVPSGRRRSVEEDQGERRRTRSSQEEAPYVPSAKRRVEEEDVERRRTRSSQEEVVEYAGFRGKRRAGALVNIKKPAVVGSVGLVGKRRSTTAAESGGGGGKRRKLAPEVEDEKERQKEKERVREEEEEERRLLLAAIEQSPYVPTPPPGVKQKQAKKEEPAPTPTPTMRQKSMFLGRRRSTLFQLEEEISDFSDYVPSPANTAPAASAPAPAPTTANRAPANPAPVVSKFVGRRRK